MIASRIHITVFEHESIFVGQKWTHHEFSAAHFLALEKYHTESKGKFYSLGFKKIIFCEYVGVIQVGNLVIEILPKADNNSTDSKFVWRSRLISMLRAVGIFNVEALSNSSLRLKTNSILDLYLDLFVKEVEFLLHQGLAKKYRKIDGNCSSVKGSIVFSKNIQQNLVHQERSFVRYNTYDVNHEIHQILSKAIKILYLINTLPDLQSRIGTILLHFPEMPDVKVSESTFLKISLNRKTERYRNALSIARLILLNFHPDVSKGKNNVLALLFDMNLLWEKFVLVSIRKGINKGGLEYKVSGQMTRSFWKPDSGYLTTVRADIVIEVSDNQFVVLDTKWKNLSCSKPSSGDLQQLFVYHHYYKADKVALIYPGIEGMKGVFTKIYNQEIQKECCLIGLKPVGEISQWQESIFQTVNEWVVRN